MASVTRDDRDAPLGRGDEPRYGAPKNGIEAGGIEAHRRRRQQRAVELGARLGDDVVDRDLDLDGRGAALARAVDEARPIELGIASSQLVRFPGPVGSALRDGRERGGIGRGLGAHA
jgi:hypothetical protein